jgi:hypothetical protein
MSDRAIITINLPVSLYGAFQVITANQAISEGEACRRIICGLSGLSDADLGSLPEPPRERFHRDLKIDLGWKYLDRLTEVTRIAKMTNSSIFRRILHRISNYTESAFYYSK